MAEICGYGSSSVSAPTFANLGVNGFGTFGSRVVGSSEWDFVPCWTTSIGQVVDTRVLGKLDKWNGSGEAWPNWRFVMKAYDWAVNRQLSQNVTSAEFSMNLVSNVQLRAVQLCFVLVMLCTGRDVDRIANSPRGWSTKAWRLLFQAFSPKNDARLVVLMVVVLAVPLATNDVMAEVGDAMYVNASVKRSLNDASKCSGRSKDSEFVC